MQVPFVRWTHTNILWPINKTNETGISMTKRKSTDCLQKGDALRAGETQRLKPGALDEHYILAVLENPFESQLANLSRAMITAEIDGRATRQRAYEIHDRLRDRIDTEILKMAKDARAMGLSTLMSLCKSADSEAVKAQVATTLTKDLFPHISIKKTQSIDDMETELQELRDKREKATGKPLH
jgi:hypothetical protein